ncbi:MFS transporter [Thermodesulfobacteriota bacterium]
MTKVAPKYVIPQFMFAHFSHHVCTGVLIPLLPIIRESFGLNYFQSGLLASCFSIAYGLGQIPMAVIADRFSSRLIIIFGLISISITGIGVSCTRTFWQMIPFFIIMGIIGASYHAPASSFISQILPINKRGRGLGLHFTGGSSSFFLTPAMALGVAYLFNTWRASFLVLAFPALLAGILLWLTTEETHGDVEVSSEISKSTTNRNINEIDLEEKASESGITWFQILRALGIITLISTTIQILSAGVRSYLPLYMVDHHNISPKLAGIVISVIAGSGIIGGPLGGAFSDRFGRKQVILVSLSFAGPLFFAVTRSAYGIPLLISMILYGLTMSVRMPSMESLIADVVPVGRRTTVLGLYFFIGMETTGIMTPVIGRLIDMYGLELIFTSVAVGLCFIAAIALFFRKHI